jgi:hypothetical protein
MNSQYHIDTQNSRIILCLLATLPVGFSRPFYTDHTKSLLFSTELVRLLRSGRTEGTPSGVPVPSDWSANPSSFCHHNHLAVIVVELLIH